MTERMHVCCKQELKWMSEISELKSVALLKFFFFFKKKMQITLRAKKRGNKQNKQANVD